MATQCDVLLVDDDPTALRILRRTLSALDLRVDTAENYDQAVGIIARKTPTRALIDLYLGERSGLELLAHIKSTTPAVHCVIMTGYGSIPTAVEAVQLGAWDYLAKSATMQQLLAALDLTASTTAKAARRADRRIPTLGLVEWEHIARVLRECDDNISEAARVLGISRRTLQRKLKKYPPCV